MTNEEVWKVIDSKFTGKAVEEHGACGYLMEDGRRCAIGLFIPAGTVFDNNVDVRCLLEIDPELWGYMPSNNLDLLGDWQLFHDTELKDNIPLKEQKAALFNKFVTLRKEYAA